MGDFRFQIHRIICLRAILCPLRAAVLHSGTERYGFWRMTSAYVVISASFIESSAEMNSEESMEISRRGLCQTLPLLFGSLAWAADLPVPGAVRAFIPACDGQAVEGSDSDLKL